LRTGGRVIDSGGVAKERLKSAGRVIVPRGIAKERLITKGRVMDAAGQALERILTLGRVAAGIAAVRCWANPESIWGRRKPKANERDRNEKKTPKAFRAVRSLYG
jgi:hypothetical protein